MNSKLMFLLGALAFFTSVPTFGDDLKVTGEVKWGTIHQDRDGNRTQALELLVDVVAVKGNPPVSYGMLVVDESMANGKPIKLGRMIGPFSNPQKNMVPVDREKRFTRHPDNGFRLDLDFEPAKGIRGIDRLKGRLKVQTGKVIEVNLGNAGSIEDGPVLHPTLEKAGVEASVKRNGEELSLQIKKGQELISALRVLTPSGKKVNTGHGQTRYQGVYSRDVSGSQKELSAGDLTVFLVTEAKIVEIPLEFENLLAKGEPKD